MSVINNKILLNGKDPGKIPERFWLETETEDKVPVFHRHLNLVDPNSGWYCPWGNNHLPGTSKWAGGHCLWVRFLWMKLSQDHILLSPLEEAVLLAGPTVQLIMNLAMSSYLPV